MRARPSTMMRTLPPVGECWGLRRGLPSFDEAVKRVYEAVQKISFGGSVLSQGCCGAGAEEIVRIQSAKENLVTPEEKQILRVAQDNNAN